MNRDGILGLISKGETTLQAYDGAKSAWDAMKTGKTASELMMTGAESLGVVPRTSGELAVAALFGAMVTIFALKGR